jgi:hypothetical protein
MGGEGGGGRFLFPLLPDVLLACFYAFHDDDQKHMQANQL